MLPKLIIKSNIIHVMVYSSKWNLEPGTYTQHPYTMCVNLYTPIQRSTYPKCRIRDIQ